jgi:hypothetical protein
LKNAISREVPKLQNFSLEMLSLFASTYVCEATFYAMNIKVKDEKSP